MASNQFIEIGSHYANIAGDGRYATQITVTYDGTDAVITTSENGAIGGMDGPGGSYPFQPTRTVTVEKATAAKLAAAVREACRADDIMKKYGKPTKKFKWGMTPATQVMNRGISTRVITNALNQYREMYG